MSSAVVEKADGTMVVTVRITLKPGRDDALISLVRRSPRGALAGSIRQAMLSGVSQAGDVAPEDAELPDLGWEL